jgi:hypothetical protein
MQRACMLQFLHYILRLPLCVATCIPGFEAIPIPRRRGNMPGIAKKFQWRLCSTVFRHWSCFDLHLILMFDGVLLFMQFYRTPGCSWHAEIFAYKEEWRFAACRQLQYFWDAVRVCITLFLPSAAMRPWFEGAAKKERSSDEKGSNSKLLQLNANQASICCCYMLPWIQGVKQKHLKNGKSKDVQLAGNSNSMMPEHTCSYSIEMCVFSWAIADEKNKEKKSRAERKFWGIEQDGLQGLKWFI